MPFINTPLAGCWLYEPVVYRDSRGYFFESYNDRVFRDQGLDYTWVQDNQSASAYGVIRGLHYQLSPHAQVKLVRVLQGTILDVAVDIRQGSPTFGQHFSTILSAENKLQLLIPAGFAHGFSVLSEKAEVLYKCNAPYSRESEGGIFFADPALGIDWQVPADQAIVSEKDLALPRLADCRNNFTFA